MTDDQLLLIVKNHLDITWTADELLDQKLHGMIKRGKTYLSRLALGNELDFKEDSKETELLLEYCLYVYAKSLDSFVADYLPELQSFQLEQEVIAYDKANPDV
jgi:hypothetical protein